MGRALIIDDSLTIRRIVELTLTANGWSVHAAGDGQTGLAALHSGHFDLVFLDYVLPDMTGLEVFRKLAAEPSRPNVVLMTAKDGVVAREFSGALSPWAVMPKPFTAEGIRRLLAKMEPGRRLPSLAPKDPATNGARVANLTLQGGAGESSRAPLPMDAPLDGAPSDAPPANGGTRRADLERFAKAMFHLLRPHLEGLTKVLRGPPTGDLTLSLGKKLLTPTAVEGMLTLAREYIQKTSPQEAEQPSTLTLAGSFAQTPPQAVLRFLSASRASGVLVFSTALGPNRGLHFLEGRPLMAAGGPTPELELASPATRQLAEQALRTTFKPALVTLAEQGVVPALGLRTELDAATRATLVELAGLTEGTYRWTPHVVPPAWLSHYGSAVPQGQIELEVARKADLRPLGPYVILERANHFSQRVQGVVLDAREQSLLQHIDGQTPLEQLVEATGVTAGEAGALAARLVAAGLARTQGRATPERSLVMVWDPDHLGFVAPLVHRLSSRGGDLEVRAMPEGALLETVLASPPQVVVVNASTPGGEGERLPRALQEKGLQVLSIGILDESDVLRESLLREAGFDAVLAKPVALSRLRDSLGRVSKKHEPMVSS